MRIKAALMLTFALFFVILGLVFHLLAILTRRWTVAIPRQARGPNDQVHYYSLWTRCQFSNTSFVTPDISSQPNIENFVCRPNLYLRYNTTDPEISGQCYESRHQCSSIVGVPPPCQCRYLSVTRVQQWFSLLAAVFLLLTIFIFYLRLIASPQNASASFLLTFAPMGLLSFALLVMLVTMILLGAYLRRNEYEDYDVKLPKTFFEPMNEAPETVNLYRLKAFFRSHPNSKLYQSALEKFRSIHEERFHARLDWSAGSEIVAIVFTFVAHVFSVILTIARVD